MKDILPLSSSNIAIGFRECTGKSISFVRDEVPLCIFRLSDVGHKPHKFYSQNLRNILLREAHLFLDRAIYQLCTYKNLILSGRLSWAAVTAYYSSFYSLCSLIRLQGKSLSWLQGQLYTVFTNNLIQDDFYIKRSNSTRTHQELWNNFNYLYQNFDFQRTEFNEIYSGSGGPTSELTIRNSITYWLGKGFDEFYWNNDELNRQIKKLSIDVFTNREGSLKDDDLRLEILASLRIKLVCQLLNLIELNSFYSSYYRAYAEKRTKFVRQNFRTASLRDRLIDWINN
jgi:hypothetical protein